VPRFFIKVAGRASIRIYAMRQQPVNSAEAKERFVLLCRGRSAAAAGLMCDAGKRSDGGGGQALCDPHELWLCWVQSLSQGEICAAMGTTGRAALQARGRAKGPFI